MPGLTTNPNLGIGIGYDGGIAYGTNKNTAIGKPRAVTGNAGIYKQKSKIDQELDKDRFKQNKKDDTDIEDYEIDVLFKSKSFSAHSKAVSDFEAEYGTDPYSLNPYANTSAHIGLHSSYNRGENVLKEFIREALQEEMLKEITCMSVRVMTKSTIGDTYKVSKANVSNINQMSPGDPSIKQQGYGQKAKTPKFYPYSDEGMPTTDGAELMNALEDDIYTEFNFKDNDYTTGDYLYDTSTREYADTNNVNNHIKRVNLNLNR